MNKEWVDAKIDEVSLKLGIFKPNPYEFYFEPTIEIYEKLATGDEQDLQDIAIRMVKHLGISPTPNVIYDWGLKMEPDVAGQIKAVNAKYNIRIPFFYVGKKHALGAILAHEMTHAFLFSRGIVINDTNQNEMFTDLTAIFIGLGKLMINGLTSATNENFNEELILGYLSPELIIYCYKRVNEYRSINSALSTKNLTKEAVVRLLM